MPATTSVSSLMETLKAKLVEEDDEDRIKVLLDLLTDTADDELPIPEITTFLLQEDTNGDLWLVTSGQTENWSAGYELLCRGWERVPVALVQTALENVIERNTPEIVGADGIPEELEKILDVVGLLEARFPVEALEPVLSDLRPEVRAYAMEALYNVQAYDRIQPFLADPHPDVRIAAIQNLAATKLMTKEQLQTFSANDPSDGVRIIAGSILQCM